MTNIEIKKITDINDIDFINDLKKLYKEVFLSEIDHKLPLISNKKNLIILIAYQNNDPVAFKIGYNIDYNTFYSWAGGTLPKYRNKGIAENLMIYQHQECLKQNIHIIETKCRPTWPHMLRLNEKFGFKIVREYLGKDGQVKYLLKKSLI